MHFLPFLFIHVLKSLLQLFDLTFGYLQIAIKVSCLFGDVQPFILKLCNFGFILSNCLFVLFVYLLNALV